MSQPIPYQRQYGFTDHSASSPAVPAPGTAFDAEFNAVLATFRGVLTNLAKLQRDDGALLNQLVTLDSLNPAVIAIFGAASHWNVRGAWATGQTYAMSDVIQAGTATYVCAVAHIASALLATDIAAGCWVMIFDSAGATPADGSVTAAKLAPSSVTTVAVGFSGLDLSGALRGAAGVRAGIGTGLMHAKLATGNVAITAERGTRATGSVGYQWLGGTGGVDWTAYQAADSDDLLFSSSASGPSLRLRSGNMVEGTGHVRSVGSSTGYAGVGVSLHFAASIGYVSSFNDDTSAWCDLQLRGKMTSLVAGGVSVLKATATGVDIIGTASRGGLDLGYLDLPQNVQSGAYTLTLGDRGRHIYSTNVAGQVITVPTNAAVPLPAGSVVVIVNDGTNPITISTTGITMKQAGTTATGNRTIAAHGLATLLKVSADTWFISGIGVS